MSDSPSQSELFGPYRSLSERLDGIEQSIAEVVAGLESDLDVVPEMAIFSYRGELIFIEGRRSSPYEIINGTSIYRIVCRLGQAGTSDTEIAFFVSGEPATTCTIDANSNVSDTLAILSISSGDVLEVEVVTAGSGAERLTIQVIVT